MITNWKKKEKRQKALVEKRWDTINMGCIWMAALRVWGTSQACATPLA